MIDDTETIEQEEMVDETPLDEEVSGDEIAPESDEDQPDSVEDEDIEDEQGGEEPAAEPQMPEHVQQQLDALTQQQAQSMQYLQGLAQAMTQMAQQRPQPQAPATPAAPAPNVNFEEMSTKEVMTYIESRMQAQYAQPMVNMAREVQNVKFRSQQLGDALALLGEGKPDFKYVQGAFELMQGTNVPFKKAMKIVKGLDSSDENAQLKKKQKQQEKTSAKRKRKAVHQSRRPDNRPKRETRAKTVKEAVGQLEKEGFYGGKSS